ncbi:unnamed protein product [Allacma fusca]|uniref:CRAL-TRIO domain-containing protein n=1 Tax=Allacma fusca TaxID=39272 RepID=A0A8J2PZX0_9HEXA|nr:unnamed protein product [Allacma fusca]
MSAPTTQELELLKKFREKLVDLSLEGEQDSDMFLLRWIRGEQDSDMFLLRWIRARENNLDHAEDMLRKSLFWRKENNLDSWKQPANLKTDLPYEIVGYDQNNCPVVMIQGGRWDFKKLVADGQRQDFLNFKQSIYEEILETMRGKTTPEGVPVTQGIFIIDLNCSSFSQMSFQVLGMMKEDGQRFEANYPEILKNLYFINAPWFLNMVMNIMKTIVSAKTVGKINVFPSDPTKWMPVLQEIVPLEILPVVYGGKNADSKLNSNLEN